MKCAHCQKPHIHHYSIGGSGFVLCPTCANHRATKLGVKPHLLSGLKEKEEFTREKVIFT